jgi:predicted nucleic acid-binding protein
MAQQAARELAVADAPALIALAKIGLLHLLADLFGTVLLSPRVEEEVVTRGLEMGAPEVAYVQQALGAGWLVRAALSSEEAALAETLCDRPGVHRGEAEALALAGCRHRVLLADEKRARTIGRSFSIQVMGTAGVLMEGHNSGHLPRPELEAAVRRLASVLWLPSEVVADILSRASEVRE